MRGVKCVWVDGCAGELTVTRQQGSAPDDQLLVALQRVGHKGHVLPITETCLRLKGVNGSGCPEKVQRALARLKGVRSVEGTSEPGARVTYDRSRIQTGHLLQAVRRAGYDAEILGKRVQPPT